MILYKWNPYLKFKQILKHESNSSMILHYSDILDLMNYGSKYVTSASFYNAGKNGAISFLFNIASKSILNH